MGCFMQFYLFCKSYEGDLLRVEKLWESIKKHNVDKIPFYLSVPSKDIDLFRHRMVSSGGLINLITDEEIVISNPDVTLEQYFFLDGRVSQQVIKAEFWRYIKKIINQDLCYLCIDSESVFIRNFYIKDFMVDKYIPYTIIHENKDLLQMAENKNRFNVCINYNTDCQLIKKFFNRNGVNYDYGPTPVIWSSKVWSDLSEKFLKTIDKNIWQIIEQNPSELRWYGEALLHFKSIEIYPREPLFRVYHYYWQYVALKKLGETIPKLRGQYLGYLKQSNWEHELDFGKQATRKSKLSILLRFLKRLSENFR